MKVDKDLIDDIKSHYTRKKFLVTGASGYLATNLIYSLKDTHCTIIRLSRNMGLMPADGTANIVDVAGDIRMKDTWEQVLEGVDVVFHFAAQTSVYLAEKDPIADLQVNVVPMLNLLEICRNKGFHPIVIFSGTVTEAGIPKNLPVNENCEDHPVTIYDIHKLMAENYLKHYVGQRIVNGAILRLANVYGPGPKSGSRDRGVVNMMIGKALAGEELTIYGEGNYLRDYVYVDDVISAFLKMLIHIEKLNGEHFVIGSGQGHTIAQTLNIIADRVALKTKHRVSVKYIVPPACQSIIETRNFVADTQQFTMATGWQARCSLVEGIDITLETLLHCGGGLNR